MAAAPSIQDRIEPSDYRVIAESVEAEWRARKKRREDLEKQWNEVDRQLRMEPELSHKMGVNTSGRLVKDPKRNWMPEIELPLQVSAHETLLSDVRRLRYPSVGDWFTCRAALTEDYFDSFRKAGTPFLGETKRQYDGEISQDDADKIVQAYLSHFHGVYDFRGHFDLIDAQAIAYGAGVGRMRRVEGRHLGYNARQQAKERETPVLVPRDIKHVYLDDSRHSLMHEGFELGPAIIQDKTIKLVDLQAEANLDDDGTWYPSEINRLTPDKNKEVTLLELEGDFAYDRGSDTVILQDVCIWVAIAGKAACCVRAFEGEKFSTYIVAQYHLEGPGMTYAAAPLLKGMPIAKAAAQALNRVIEAGLLKNFPPLAYSPDDPYFKSNGGPDVHPKALWETSEGVVPADVGGDPQILFAIFQGLVQMYEDMATGVTPARRGAQTKSHTTRFAKQVELERGQVRTVDYVRSTLHGQMTRLLDIEYRMGLEMMHGNASEVVFIEEWDEFVQIKKGHLPDIVRFLAIGSDAPADEQARIAERLAGGQAALQLDAGAAQLGQEPVIKDHSILVERLLRDSGWSSADIIALLGDSSAEAAGTAPDQQPGILGANPTLLG